MRFLFGNYILTVAVLSWLAAQVSKTIINFVLTKKFELERMWGAGGMPSAHSALVCSTFVAVAKSEGIQSPLFAIAFILAAIVMYDAMGVRHEAGKQAKVLNRMIASDWFTEDTAELFQPKDYKLKEQVGHTPIEVLSGALLGILISVLIPIS